MFELDENLCVSGSRKIPMSGPQSFRETDLRTPGTDRGPQQNEAECSGASARSRLLVTWKKFLMGKITLSTFLRVLGVQGNH